MSLEGEKMYKILIVDDESIERKAIRYIIENSHLNIAEIEEASNGQEAVSKAEVFEPNITFLDIKMPGLSGIEAAKILKKANSENMIIFLTAFDEFEFAQEAIKIGVEDFIIKPATNERILEVLNKTIDKLDKLKQIHIDKKDMEDKLSKITKYLEREFVSSVVLGEIDEEQAKDYLNFIMAEFKRGFGMVIQLKFYKEDGMPPLQQNMIQRRFVEKISSILEKSKIRYLMNYFRYRVYILVYGYPENEKDFCAAMIGDELQKLAKKMGEQFDTQINIGIGNEYHKISELWKSFSQAKVACENTMVLLEETEDLQNYKADSLEIKEKKLCESILDCNEQEAIAIVDDILDNIIYSSNDINEVRLKLYEFLVLLNKSLNSNRNMRNKIPENLFDDLKNICCKADGKMYVQEYLSKVMEEINQLKADKTGLMLEKAKKYIHQHYNQDISLDDIASMSGFSTYYFCKMFKKYYHVSFTDYLTSLRIKHAKELLQNPDLSIKEITEMIGYLDSNYFTRVFKKYEGLTPTEYRQINMLR